MSIESDATEAWLQGEIYDGQTIEGRDSVRLVPPQSETDSDGDGFTDAAEICVGTDPLDNCGTNAWPPDTFEDQLVDGQDLVAFLPALFKGFGEGGYSARLDIFQPGTVIDGQDLVAVLPFMFKDCQPPPP